MPDAGNEFRIVGKPCRASGTGSRIVGGSCREAGTRFRIVGGGCLASGTGFPIVGRACREAGTRFPIVGGPWRTSGAGYRIVGGVCREAGTRFRIVGGRGPISATEKKIVGEACREARLKIGKGGPGRCVAASEILTEDWPARAVRPYRGGVGVKGGEMTGLAMTAELSFLHLYFLRLVFRPLHGEWLVTRFAAKAAACATNGGEHFRFGRLGHVRTMAHR